MWLKIEQGWAGRCCESSTVFSISIGIRISKWQLRIPRIVTSTDVRHRKKINKNSKILKFIDFVSQVDVLNISTGCAKTDINGIIRPIILYVNVVYTLA